jgi:hypothetical protein
MESGSRAAGATPSPLPLAAVLFAAASLLAGCIAVDGGAIEARWELRKGPKTYPKEQGQTTSCTDAGLSKIRFVLSPVASGCSALGSGTDDPCAQDDRCLFDCEPHPLGTTAFVIPIGTYCMVLRGVDASTGALLTEADGIISPDPVVRDVRLGELTDLSVNLIIVER